MATFIKFYGMDPLEITYERFLALWNAIPEVQQQFIPKDPLQAQLDKKESQIREYQKEKAAKLKSSSWEL